MGRTYYANHQAKLLEVNFNQKQWRQDFAEFIKNKLSWDCEAFVSRPKYDKRLSAKSFEVHNLKGESINFEFINLHDVLSRDDNLTLVEEYLNLRGTYNAT